MATKDSAGVEAPENTNVESGSEGNGVFRKTRNVSELRSAIRLP